MPRILFPCRKYFAAQVSERHAMSVQLQLRFTVIRCCCLSTPRRGTTNRPCRDSGASEGPHKKTVDTERDVVDGLGDAIGASSLSTPMQSSLDVYIVYALHLSTSSLNSYPI